MASHMEMDMHRIRGDFPALHQHVHGKPLVYLDNAATTLKPRMVMEAIRKIYEEDCANIHRGVHELSQRATRAYEAVRDKVRRLINAHSTHEVVFVRGTTEAINLVAHTYGRVHVHAGDEVIVSAMEHHSNIVPWQMLCEERGAVLRVIPMNDRGELLLDAYAKLLGPKTRIVAVNHVSNALGTINPITDIVQMAHAHGAKVLVDGAQAIAHMPVDVQALGCDFYAFSGHKLYGPTGIGVLWGKKSLLEAMPPYQGGGDMIRTVTFEKSTYAGLPHKFEAGTPHIAGVVGLGAAIDYVTAIGLTQIEAYEKSLYAYAVTALSQVGGLRFIGEAAERAGALGFLVGDIHPHDLGTIVDREGVAIRAGHHCAQPVMQRFHIAASARASFGMYNTPDEIDVLVAALNKAKALFAQ